MSGKKDHILLSTTATIYDVIVLTETWLNENKFDFEFFDPRFIVYRKDRSESNIDAGKGGGVLIAIDSKYNSEIVEIPEMDSLEAICVKINLQSSGSCLYIYGLYIQCGSNEDVYLSHLNALLKAHSMVNHGDIFVAVGDFNMSSIKWSCNDDGFDYLPLIGDSTSIPATIARTVTSPSPSPASDEFESYQDQLFNALMTDLAANYKKKPRKFWNFINSKYKANALPGKMYFGNEEATIDIEKANLFAKFFASLN